MSVDYHTSLVQGYRLNENDSIPSDIAEKYEDYFIRLDAFNDNSDIIFGIELARVELGDAIEYNRYNYCGAEHNSAEASLIKAARECGLLKNRLNPIPKLYLCGVIS